MVRPRIPQLLCQGVASLCEQGAQPLSFAMYPDNQQNNHQEGDDFEMDDDEPLKDILSLSQLAPLAAQSYNQAKLAFTMASCSCHLCLLVIHEFVLDFSIHLNPSFATCTLSS